MRFALLPLLLAFALLLLVHSPGLAAQEAAAGSLRPYWHVFVAYAAAWVLVAGWVFHLARRLSGAEERLEE